jgi:hypothetical protein
MDDRNTLTRWTTNLPLAASDLPESVLHVGTVFTRYLMVGTIFPAGRS